MKINNFVKGLENIPWTTLKKWEFNQLKDNENRDVTKLKATILEDGFSFPFIAWKEGKYVIDGAGRSLALNELEADGKDIGELPVVFIQAKDKTDAKKKALLISSTYGDITKGSLKTFAQDLDITLLDNVQIGQKPLNLDDLIDKDKMDDVIPTKIEPRAKAGQVYRLGQHRVMCGSSTDQKDLEKLLNGEKMDMVFTDPPYNVNYSGKGETTTRTIENDNMSEEQFDEFLDDTFEMAGLATKDDAPMYIFHSSSTQIQFEAALNRNAMEVINQIIWNKPTASMGWGDYRFKHEPMFYAKKQAGKVEFFGDRTNTTIWDFQKDEKDLIMWAKREKEMEREGLTTIWTMKRDSVSDYVHPTQKPVELIEHAIKNSSLKGSMVIDLFGGSGSTMIACEKLRRKAYTMELDPDFVDIIIQRWEDYTNQKAVLED